MKNKVNEALGLMKDAHIDEAANYKKTHWGWIPAAAAVLAVVIAVGVVAQNWQRPPASLEQPSVGATESVAQPTVQPTEPSVEPTQPIIPSDGGTIIWAKRSAVNFFPEVEEGEIAINLNLKEAMEASTNPADRFAVRVGETTFKDREEVYKEFILPLGAEEDYMENGVVYLTKSQIENLRCPEDMTIRLMLSVPPDVPLVLRGEPTVTEEYFQGLEDEDLNLCIVFEDLDCYCDERASVQSCAFDEHLNAFLEDYGISGVTWRYLSHIEEHCALLWDVDVQTVYKMLSDPRIHELWNMYSLDKNYGDLDF